MRPILAGVAALLGAHAPALAAAEGGWVLVWSDEFDGTAIDRARWSLEVECWGGGNEERQCYTDRAGNAAIENGKLVITARHERSVGPALPKAMRRKAAMPDQEVVREFSSAKLTTRGKASWRHGRIEVRSRLPQGQGTWPAIWMMPERETYGGWAASGEIDILEAVNLGVPCATCPGGLETRILGTLHFGGKWPDNKQAGAEFPFPAVLDGDFHIYAVEWHPDRIIWQVDGRSYAERRADEWSTTGASQPGAPFDQPFHLIVNLAIGGKLAESRGVGGVVPADYPKRMEVDWVRVWQIPGMDPGDRKLGKDQGGS